MNAKIMNTTLQEVYDEFASVYDENRGAFDISSILESFYGRLAGKAGNLLDLGCGAGDPVARFFVERNWSVTGVDFSEKMLELAARYVPEMKTIHADIARINMAAEEFDAIIASYSLFHVPAKEHAALFGRIYRWLRPGGNFLFTYATEQYTGQSEFDGHIDFMGKLLYYSHKSPPEMLNDLQNSGFEVEAKDYISIGGETFLWVTAGKPPAR